MPLGPRLRATGLAPPDDALVAMADPTRWRMLNLVAAHGEEVEVSDAGEEAFRNPDARAAHPAA